MKNWEHYVFKPNEVLREIKTPSRNESVCVLNPSQD